MTETIAYIAGILFMLLGVAVSIAWHELGHLLPAKKFGARVPKYMVGFGPTLFSRKKGETEYGIKAIPLGGYISISGMFPPEKGKPKTSWLSKWVSDARAHQREVDGEFDESRSFYRLSIPKRITIMLGGPVMNLILGFVLIIVALSAIGAPQTSTQLAAISDCIPASATATECKPGDVESPAKISGILAGDRIIAVNGQVISEWSQVDAILKNSAGIPLEIKLDRNGEILTTEVLPVVAERAVYDPETGQPKKAADGTLVTAPKVMIGVQLGTELKPVPLDKAVSYSGVVLGETFKLVVALPAKLVEVAGSLTGSQRNVDTPVSLIGVGQIAGEVASSDATFASKMASQLLMLGSLNFALFVFNLIPLLPLDGGHVLSAIYEAIKRAGFKLAKKKDPGPVDTAKMVPFTMAMWIVLMGMSVLIIAADLINPIQLG
ncbi:MAG: M50 family metallopeptidase [Micrococcales bacterium]